MKIFSRLKTTIGFNTVKAPIYLGSLFILLFCLHLSSCTEEKQNSKKKSQPDKKYEVEEETENQFEQQYIKCDTNSELYLYYPVKTVYHSSNTEIDFKNFVYFDYLLKDGLYYLRYDTGFDSLAFVESYKISKNLFLVNLYHAYGGGSSEISNHLYLFDIQNGEVVLNSHLWAEGYFKPKIDSNIITIKGYNYNNGKDGRCCPSMIETGNFVIKDRFIECIDNKFEKIESK